MKNDACKDQNMKVDMDDKAIPEIHIHHVEEASDKEPSCVNSENETNDSIDYSGAIPEIHFGHKKK